MLVAAVIIAVVGVFGFVGAVEVSANLVVDVEADGVLGVENRLVSEDKNIR